MSKLIKRYKRDQYKVFDNEYDMRLTGSRILSPNNVNLGLLTFIWNESNCRNELMKLIGAEKGYYLDNFGDTVQATIPLIESQLTALDLEFEAFNIQREMKGQIVLEEMPTHLLDRRLQLEASLDVHLSEKEVLESKLKEYASQAEEIRETQVLQVGLRQNVQLRGNKIDTIDNQSVTYIDNVPIINDKKSPYFGMSVQDYRILSDKWLADRRQADKEKLRKLQEQDKINGMPLRKSLPLKTRKTIEIGSLPKFPKEFKNYLVKETVK